jgi:hypothetical protein
MRKRTRQSLAAIGCAAALTVTAVGAAEVNDHSGGGARLVADRRPIPTDAVLKYWADSKTALSPLLLYVRQLPLSVKAVRDSGGQASSAQLHQAKIMASSFADARDLVGRIAVPATAPHGVGELLQAACQLYRQSALTLREVAHVPAGEPRVAAAARAGALLAVGDRLFDQVRRTLAIDSIGQDNSPTEFQYLPPVPAVADLPGGAAKPSGSSVDDNLREAGRLINQASAGAPLSPADSEKLRSIASALEISKGEQGEDVIGARLAIALAVIANNAQADGQARSADEILMISNDLWNQASTLESHPRSVIERLGAPKLSRDEIWTGGQFDGHPPALKPGQDVGSGLRGGLPKVDPTQILKG